MERNLAPVQRYCLNCGALINGIREADGIAKLTCRRCCAVIISKPKSRRHDRIDVFLPEGEVMADYA